MILAPIILTSHIILAKASNVKKWYVKIETIEAVVTAYDAQEFSGLDAAGGYPLAGWSIACPRKIPFGTNVVIDNREFVCADRTAMRFDGRFDLFVATRREALAWGKRKEKIIIHY